MSQHYDYKSRLRYQDIYTSRPKSAENNSIAYLNFRRNKTQTLRPSRSESHLDELSNIKIRNRLQSNQTSFFKNNRYNYNKQYSDTQEYNVSNITNRNLLPGQTNLSFLDVKKDILTMLRDKYKTQMSFHLFMHEIQTQYWNMIDHTNVIMTWEDFCFAIGQELGIQELQRKNIHMTLSEFKKQLNKEPVAHVIILDHTLTLFVVVLCYNSDNYTPPGGKRITFQDGSVESVRDACIREVMEETGVDVSNLLLEDMIHIQTKEKDRDYMIAKSISNTESFVPSVKGEVESVRWAFISELRDYIPLCTHSRFFPEFHRIMDKIQTLTIGNHFNERYDKPKLIDDVDSKSPYKCKDLKKIWKPNPSLDVNCVS